MAACLLGVASKEIVATAPLAVLFYDRTFLAGSFRQAWRRRRGLYLGLAATWAPLAVLWFGTHARGDSIGFHYGVTPGQYALTQCTAVARYLRLSFWPSQLCLDYGSPVAKTAGEIVPAALLLAGLALATLWALVRRPGLSFLGVFFLLTLGPTSSFLPIAVQTMAEHRMYLALAAVVAAAVVVVDLLLGQLLRRLKLPRPRQAAWHATIAAALVGAAALALGTRTWLRNRDYRSELSIWDDTVRQRPLNARAQTNLAIALAACGRVDEAIVHYRQALAVKPRYAAAEYNLANALAGRGQLDEAIAHYRTTLEVQPDYAGRRVTWAMP